MLTQIDVSQSQLLIINQAHTQVYLQFRGPSF